ncbi:hypothetical protein [Actinacidiphila reveromycinica]|uniref:hypothetical protein n=1 Tax=Actinacidiphila reveromycinica TaxID=659352 RepID=UPI00192338D6|nr:hypothetical protein [Streptomyces sp. SN-593]
MDVETVLLCDVLPDGTIAGQALVEPVYDTSTGERIGTRTVDPVTGDTYTPSGTLTACGASDGCNATTSVLVLCDTATDGTATQFVRATTYDCEGTLIATLDRTLDGAAYAPAGTVGVCPASPDCESPTTPTATVGLCLADGTPIAVTVVRDCTGAVTSEGWINLTSGAYSAGAPPAGTTSCGSSQSVQVSGTFCDVDDAGDVVGLVLIEYSYADDGTIDAVRLVDAVTGDTYTPTGTVTTCPAGVEQPERDLVQLCDTATDGTSTPFVRDYGRDENGAIVGHSDYGLDGTPYTPAGTVGVCQPPDPEPCRSSTTLPLCDSAPLDVGALVVATATDPTPYFQTGDGVTKRIVLVDPQPLFDGGTIVVAGPAGGEPTPEPVHRYAAALLTLPADACPPCGDWPDTLTLTVAATATNDGPAAGNAVCGRYTLFNGATVLGENEIRDTPVGGFSNFSVTADVSYADLVAGTIALKMDLETRHMGQKSWTVSDFTITLDAVQAGCGTSFLRTIRRDCVTGDLVDVLDTDYEGQPYTPVGEVASCTAHSTCGSSSGGGGNTSDCEQCSPLVLCDAVPGAAPVPFLRTICLNCIGGVVGVMDTELDGVTAYEVAGTVVDCAAAGDCPSSYSTECWEVVTAKASYDNTQGSPCGSVTPNMDQCAGTWRLNSWIVDGVELVTGTPPTFVATGCGGAADQLHGAWAATLATLDPDAGWAAAYNGQCLFFIQAATANPDVVYGQMLLERTAGGTPTAYTLGSAQTRQSTTYTKRFTQECDGSTTVTWLDADGEEVDEPEGELRSCGGTDPTDPTDPDGQAVDTGVRAVTGTAAQDLVAEFTGVQSVSLTVLAGAVAVTMTDGAAVEIPAGVAMTWSVSKPTDTALSAASFAGADASAEYLLNWTRR